MEPHCTQGATHCTRGKVFASELMAVGLPPVNFHIPCFFGGCPWPRISLGRPAHGWEGALPIPTLAELRVLQSAGLFPMSWLALRYSPGHFLPRLCLEALGRSASLLLSGRVCVLGVWVREALVGSGGTMHLIYYHRLNISSVADCFVKQDVGKIGFRQISMNIYILYQK